MTTPDDTTPPEPSARPLTVLRAGGGRDINTHVVVRVVVAVVLVGLTALTVGLFIAGVHRNSQIDNLRQHGVPVQVSVTGCMGLLGGSGSNAAGYSCKVVLESGGHRYVDALPGDSFYQPGTVLHAVTVAGDPSLITLASTVSGEHASGRVFILPTILLVLLVLFVVFLLLWRQRRMARSSRPAPPA